MLVGEAPANKGDRGGRFGATCSLALRATRQEKIGRLCGMPTTTTCLHLTDAFYDGGGTFPMLRFLDGEDPQHPIVGVVILFRTKRRCILGPGDYASGPKFSFCWGQVSA